MNMLNQISCSVKEIKDPQINNGKQTVQGCLKVNVIKDD